MHGNILIVVDRPDWAIARNVDAQSKRLAGKYAVSGAYFARPESVKDERGYRHFSEYDFAGFDLIVTRALPFAPPEMIDRLEGVGPARIADTIGGHRVFDDVQFSRRYAEFHPLFANVLCVSDEIYEKACGMFTGGGHSVFFTPMGIETDVFFNRRDDRNEKFTIGWAGNAAHGGPLDHKRFYSMVVPLVQALHGRYSFRLAAKNVDREIAAYLASMGVPVDKIDFGSMADFYNGVDLLLNCSASEGIASTTVEALACGTPVVTTDVGFSRNMIIDGVNGRIVEPRIDHFIRAIEHFTRADYGRIFRVNEYIVKNLFDWDLAISFTETAFDRIIDAADRLRCERQGKQVSTIGRAER